MNASTKKIADLHQQFADVINQELNGPLRQFQARQREVKAQLDQDTRKMSKEVKNQIRRVKDAKSVYENKFDLMKKAVKLVSQGQQDNMTKREYQKIQEKAIKAKKEFDNSEREYKELFSAYEAAQNAWDHHVTRLAQTTQLLEQKRMSVLKSLLNKVTSSQCKLLATDFKAVAEEMQASASSIKPDQDMSNWVLSNQTGTQKQERLQLVTLIQGNPRRATINREAGSLYISNGEIRAQLPEIPSSPIQQISMVNSPKRTQSFHGRPLPETPENALKPGTALSKQSSTTNRSMKSSEYKHSPAAENEPDHEKNLLRSNVLKYSYEKLKNDTEEHRGTDETDNLSSHLVRSNSNPFDSSDEVESSSIHSLSEKVKSIARSMSNVSMKVAEEIMQRQKAKRNQGNESNGDVSDYQAPPIEDIKKSIEFEEKESQSFSNDQIGIEPNV